MDLDPLRDAWQSQPLPAVDVDPIAAGFRRGQRQFAATIFRRDVVEVATGLILLPAWVGVGVGFGLPRTWCLMMPGMAWVVAFLVLDRRRQARRRARPGDPPTRAVAGALGEVEHQIGLLRTVHWWYLLPPGLPMPIFFADVAWRASRGDPRETAVATVVATAVVAASFLWAYRVHQGAVRATLEPRRRELADLLRSLADEPPP